MCCYRCGETNWRVLEEFYDTYTKEEYSMCDKCIVQRNKQAGDGSD